MSHSITNPQAQGGPSAGGRTPTKTAACFIIFFQTVLTMLFWEVAFLVSIQIGLSCRLSSRLFIHVGKYYGLVSVPSSMSLFCGICNTALQRQPLVAFYRGTLHIFRLTALFYGGAEFFRMMFEPDGVSWSPLLIAVFSTSYMLCAAGMLELNMDRLYCDAMTYAAEEHELQDFFLVEVWKWVCGGASTVRRCLTCCGRDRAA
ncbi:hypothetical protein OG21DRAFT_1600599, partial [Imleria badia]